MRRTRRLPPQNAVTAALVDYQDARLQLLLDIGALDTDMPKFWLKDHLAGIHAPAPAAGRHNRSRRGHSRRPPDQFFNELTMKFQTFSQSARPPRSRRRPIGCPALSASP